MGGIGRSLGIGGITSFLGGRERRKSERKAERKTEASRLEGRQSYLDVYREAIKKGQWTPEKRAAYMKGISSLIGDLVGGMKRRAVGTATETGRGGGYLGSLLSDINKQGLKMKGEALAKTFIPRAVALPSAGLFGGQTYAPRTSPMGETYDFISNLSGMAAGLGMTKMMFPGLGVPGLGQGGA